MSVLQILNSVLALSLILLHFFYRGKHFVTSESPIPPIQNANVFTNTSFCDSALPIKTKFCPTGNVSFGDDNNHDDFLTAVQKDDQEDITEHIKNIYFSRVRSKFGILPGQNKEPIINCRQKYLYYSCDRKKINLAPRLHWGCCGLGDRFRGVVTSFYAALLTDSIFMLDWITPVPLDQFFVINSEMYGISSYRKNLSAKIYDSCVEKTGTLPYWNFVQGENLAAEFVTSPLVSAISNSSNDGIMMSLNSFLPINTLMTAMPDIFGPLIKSYGLASLTYTQLISAALQIIFGNPQPRLQWVVNRIWNTTVGRNPQSKGQTMGIHLRFNVPGWSERSRIQPNQTLCFLNEVKKIVKEKGMKHPAIFVTGDNRAEVTRLMKWLKNDGFEAVYRSPYNRPTHMDLPVSDTSSVERQWQDVAGIFRDWLLLTRFDYRIISRSSFAETAAIFSRNKPTRRFNHGFKKSCVFTDYNSLDSLFLEGF